MKQTNTMLTWLNAFSFCVWLWFSVTDWNGKLLPTSYSLGVKLVLVKSEVLGVGGNWHTVLKPIEEESPSGGLRPVGSWCHYKCDIMSTASPPTIRRVILSCRATPITFNHCFFACSCRRLQTFSFLFFSPFFHHCMPNPHTGFISVFTIWDRKLCTRLRAWLY